MGSGLLDNNYHRSFRFCRTAMEQTSVRRPCVAVLIWPRLRGRAVLSLVVRPLCPCLSLGDWITIRLWEADASTSRVGFQIVPLVVSAIGGAFFYVRTIY